MRTQYTPKIIFSVFDSKLDIYENYSRHVSTKKYLKEAGVSFEEVNGVYKGEAEHSFIIKDTLTNRTHSWRLAKMFQQESVLLMDNEGTGLLFYLDSGKTEVLGRLKVTNRKPQGDYSKIGNTYFNFV